MSRRTLLVVILVDLGILFLLTLRYPDLMVSPGPLVPAHRALATDCFSCHTPFGGAVTDRCTTCHALGDIGVRTATGEPLGGESPPGSRASFHQALRTPECTSCHAEHRGSTKPHFSHEALEPAAREGCASCHAAPVDDLHRDLGTACGSCHTTAHWEPATFEHDRLPKGVLERCESCHRAPADAFHRQSPGACASCHATTRWKPSTFDHDRYFVLDGDHRTTCATCHVNDEYSRYTCYGCHEHTPANIRAEHEEEGIRDFEGCVRCHRSAEDEPGERGGGRRERGGDDDD